MKQVCVVILTYNEAIHIKRALDSVSSFAREVFIIDSYSTDATVEIAKANGAKVLQNPFVNQADQFQWAMDNITCESSWILRLDADEIIEPDLALKIFEEIGTLPSDIVGINFDRKHIFMGKWIKHGGRYPVRMLRLFRRAHGRIEQRWMDEHILVSGGRTILFTGGFADNNLHDLAFFTAKHNAYATREAADVLIKKYALLPGTIEMTPNSSSLHTSLKRTIKEKIYNKIPFSASALTYFFYRYIFQLGFLDGREGLVYHVLQGYWYRFLVGARTMELSRELDACQGSAGRLALLQRLTGLRINGK